MNSKSKKWYLLSFLALVSAVSFITIDTFDRREIGAWLFFGIPVSVSIAIYLNYREYLGSRGKISHYTVVQSFIVATICGLLISVLTIGIFELCNAAIPLKNVNEEFVLVRKWKTGGMRSGALYAEFMSTPKRRIIEVQLNGNEFYDLESNSAYRLRYKEGLFGWAFKIGPLDYGKIQIK